MRGEKANSPPRFSLGYLLLLVTWWCIVFALYAVVLRPASPGNHLPEICVFLSPVPIGAACGGLFLRMRFGFVTGLCIATPIWLYIVWCVVWDAISN